MNLASLRLDGLFAADGGGSLPRTLPDSWFATAPAVVPAAPAVAPDGLPVVGEVIDKYRIDAELGRGGFAVVYRAMHLLMHTPVALKVLYPSILRKHPHLSEQLCEEARFTSLIDHPNVVRVHDVAAGQGGTYIVMEFIDGYPLSRLIARRPLDAVNLLKVAIHICAGLKAGLDKGLIHRDIKPGNILISRAGHAKIVDFGLARRAQRSLSDDDSSLRRTLHTAGTPAYIAPEQVTDFDAADFRADMYSLGASLYHAGTGLPPFAGEDPVATLRCHLNDDPMHPCDRKPELPRLVGDLIMTLLAKRPDDRPASYADLDRSLRAALDAIRAPAQPANPTPPTPPVGQRLRALLRPR